MARYRRRYYRSQYRRRPRTYGPRRTKRYGNRRGNYNRRPSRRRRAVRGARRVGGVARKIGFGLVKLGGKAVVKGISFAFRFTKRGGRSKF